MFGALAEGTSHARNVADSADCRATRRIVEALGARVFDVALPVASAQVKSAVLLAGLGAEGATRVREPAPSRDHTERLLAHLGAPVHFGEGVVQVEGGATLRPFDLDVPGDISSAAFFLA